MTTFYVHTGGSLQAKTRYVKTASGWKAVDSGVGDNFGVGEMLLTNEEIAALPASGVAWDYMKAQADIALASLDVTGAASDDSPWLPNYNGDVLDRPATQTLAMALVYAKTGTTTYKDKVIAACKYLIGSEDSSSTDGTSDSDKMLAAARQIPAWVMAADLVGMDPTEVGSRASYTAVAWDDWLLTLRDKEISDAVSGRAFSQCNNERAHNWAAFCSASRAAIDIYLGDTTDLNLCYDNFKRYCGDRTVGGLGADNVPNGGFETNTTGWSSSATTALTTFARQSGWAKVGTYSCRITCTGAGASESNGIRTTTGTGGIPVTAGTSYQFRAAVNVLDLPTGGNTRMRAWWYDSGGSAVSNVNCAAYTTTGEFTMVDTLEAPVGAAFLAISIYGHSGSVGGELHDMYVDHIRCKPVVAVWTNSSDFDSSYVCIDDLSPVANYDIEADWLAINPSNCGDRKNGLIVEDISRSTVSYAASGAYYDEDPGVTYMYEAFCGQLVAAILMENAGKTVWTLSSSALLRVHQWLNREGYSEGVGGYDVYRYPSFVINHFYNTSYSTYSGGAKQSRCFGYADWIYG